MVDVAIDVGGTFTDFVINDNGELNSFKLLSTPSRPEVAIFEGLRRIGTTPRVLLHATTLATNALLGQMGLELPRVALFATKGFGDVVEIGRQNRPSLYDLFFEKPKQFVPAEFRFEVDERVDYTGNVLRGVDEAELEKTLSGCPDFPAVAVSFLHSYANPENEKTVKNRLMKRFQHVSASFEVAPEPREYERTSTALLNAVLMPIMAGYLQSLEDRLGEMGGASLFVMASSGGLVNTREARARPVQLIESGPAAGVIAAAELAKMLRLPRVISFDMGGTTAKAGTAVDYGPELTSEYEVGGDSHYGRILKGSGYPVRFPFVDLAEVSAGGGTVVWKDEAGAIHVGPLSAGAEPGPISYGRGGTKPTLTDANLVQGRLSENLLGGEMSLDKEGAARGFSALGDALEVASSATRLANLEMARAIRLVTVERGLDPAEFALMVFGGAGPQHAAEIADELGVRRVLIPPEPGAFSALGMLLADNKVEARSSFPKDPEKGFVVLESKLAAQAEAGTYFARYAELKYVDQGWEVMVSARRPAVLAELERSFEEKHQALYGFTLKKKIEVVTIRAFAITPRSKPKMKGAPAAGEARVKGNTKAYFGEWVEAPIFHRNELSSSFKADGPLRIEEYGSCTLVPPGWKIGVAEIGTLVMER